MKGHDENSVHQTDLAIFVRNHRRWYVMLMGPRPVDGGTKIHRAVSQWRSCIVSWIRQWLCGSSTVLLLQLAFHDIQTNSLLSFIDRLTLRICLNVHFLIFWVICPIVIFSNLKHLVGDMVRWHVWYNPFSSTNASYCEMPVAGKSITLSPLKPIDPISHAPFDRRTISPSKLIIYG